jgi:hypothetical protein
MVQKSQCETQCVENRRRSFTSETSFTQNLLEYAVQNFWMVREFSHMSHDWLDKLLVRLKVLVI